MDDNLNNTSKFQVNGSTKDKDNTANIESRIQRQLLKLYNSNVTSESVYKQIRPSGSQRPRMYGLPKIHKKGIPLLPILYMIGFAQYKLAKFLTNLLQPVLQPFSSKFTYDSFSFAAEI